MKLAKTVLATFCFLLSLALCTTSALAADFNETQKLAEQGDARAQFNLAIMYENGDGVPQDNQKAVEWYRKAAEQGHANAQLNLGFMYEKSYGVPQDKQKAVEWYRKAAEQGHATAQYNLAIMYKKGEGVPQDKKKAVEWYHKAAEQGFASAQYSLGIMYYNGEGVQQDKKKAIEWFQKAAEQGHAHAQFELGDMYDNGDGVEQNKAIANEWYGKACAKGLEKACKAVKSGSKKSGSKKSGLGFEPIFVMCAVVLFLAGIFYYSHRDKKKKLASIPEDFKYVYFMFADNFLAIDLRNQKMLLSKGPRKIYDFSDLQGHEREESYISRKGRRTLWHHLRLHVNDPEKPTWGYSSPVKDEIDCAELLVSCALDGTLPDIDERRIIDDNLASVKKIMSFLSTGTGAQG